MGVSTSAELLDFCELMSGLPTENEEMNDAKWYKLLTLAQKEMFRIFASHVPHSQYGAPELLTTSDGGYTYNLANYPWGRVVVRESREGRILYPGAEYDSSVDFTIEGDTIRWVNNEARTFSDGPYARYVAAPGDISAVSEPTLQPLEARIAIAWRALELWCSMGRMRDPAHYAREIQKLLWGDPNSRGDIGMIGALKIQYQFQDGTDGPSDHLPWFRSQDFNNSLLP